MKRMFYFVFFLIVATESGRVQEIGQQLKRIRELQRLGEGKYIEQLYEKLYQMHPENVNVMNQYRDFCIKNQNYNKAMELVQKGLQKRPNDLNLQSYLARIHFKMGRQERAMQLWNSLIDQNKKKVQIYHIVAGAMTQERLYDEAIDVYLMGRKRINKEQFFTLNLANLYGVTIQYGKAIQELIIYLKEDSRRFSVVETQLFKYPKSRRIYRDVVHVLENDIKKDEDALTVRRLLANYFLHMERFDDALQVTVDIEEDMKDKSKRGEVLFAVAEKAFKMGAAIESEKAYSYLLNHYPEFSHMDQVYFGIAQSQEAQKKYQQAIDHYYRVFQKFPKSRLAGRSLLRMGYIQKDELFFPDEASDTFRLLNRSYPNTEENRKADLALAGCLLTQGKFDEAKEMYQEMFETRQAKQDFFWISALVHLAEIHFMQEEFDTALKVLEEITQSDFDPSQAAEPMLNDGLCLRLFLKSHTRDNPEPLILFARGVKHEKQRQFKQAIIVLDSLISLWSGTSVVPEALLMKGKIHMGLNQNKKALSALNIIIKQHPMSMVSDQAMERKGWILEKTGKRKEALDTYEALLLKYPQSFLIDEIRSRIRRLEEEI